MIEELFNKIPKFLQNPDPEIYLNGNFVVLDFETTVLDKGSPYNRNNTILCGSWERWENGECKYTHMARGNEFEQELVVEHIDKSDFLVAHNAAFEIGWLQRCGLDIHRVLPFCTQLAEWVIAGNRPWGKYASLEDSLHRRGLPGKESSISTLIRKGVDTRDIPPEYLSKYCTVDVVRTRQLFFKQLEILKETGLLPVCFSRNIFIPCKVDIEQQGMHLDKKRVKLVYESLINTNKELEQKFNNLTEGLNFRSAKQKREYIYGELGFSVPRNALTALGEPKVDKPTLGRLRASTAPQRAFLSVLTELTQVASSLSKYMEKFNECVDQTDDQIFDASINQASTATHRLSSSGRTYRTQIQNIPREFKPLFSARRSGWEIAEIDEAGLEFRIAAELAHCPEALRFIEDRNDPHEFSARIVFKGKYDESKPAKSPENKDFRQRAKEHTFKPLYGGKSGTTQERAYYQAFREKFSGITRTQDVWIAEVLRTKELVTATGLRFYWPDTKVTPTGFILNSQSICNYPVQSLATADLVPVAVVYQYQLMRAAEMESFLINIIHDSSVGEVSPKESELYEEIAVQSFTSIITKYLSTLYNITLKLPLEVEYTSTKYWSDNNTNWESKWEKVL